MIQLEKLFKAGVHFGHQKRRWCPKMEPYIWGFKNNVHLIDISKTAFQLEKAAKFLKQLVGKGETVLWVGTKKPAQDVIKSVATKLDMPYVSHRWIGGTLSNFAQVKKSVTKYLHYKDILAKADKYPHYTKKELNVIGKAAARLEQNVGGILNLKWPVGALVLVDVLKEGSALREATTMNIPVIALVDTNADPSMVDFVIPTNDDSPRAIQVLIDYLGEAAQKGKESFEAKKEEERLAKQAEKDAAKAKKEKEDKKTDAKAPVKKAESTKKAVASAPVKKTASKETASKETAVKASEEKPAAKATDKKTESTKKAVAGTSVKKTAPKETAVKASGEKPAAKATDKKAVEKKETKKEAPSKDKK
ncbi:MAG: 30S ribosomal protein S2 [Candidatus Dependentiae bacterium]